MSVSMTDRKEAIACASALKDVYEDYPFHDPNWCVMRHKKNKKTFALIYEREGRIWINVKCDPEWRDFWPDQEIRRMISESYDLTKPKTKNRAGKEKKICMVG